MTSRATNVETLQRRIRVARGDAPGDLVLTGGRIVNVFTQQLEAANVVIADGWIAGIGPYTWDAGERLAVDGGFILPGLIDAHMHVESTLLMPAELARLAVPHGTSAIVADPHEIANVFGVRGVELLLAASENLPLDIFFMAPSCVPATRWEDAGAALDAAAIDRLLRDDRVLGLAEVMDFPAVLAGRSAMLEKIAVANEHRAAVDGHAPGMIGQPLVAYAAAGIRADHESTSADEAAAKASLGMMVQVREGSSAKNLEALLPLIVEDRLGDWCLATDDIHPDELRHGHIDRLLARVVSAGVPAPRAVRHATLVPARHYGLNDRGAVAPGRCADLVVVDDLERFRPRFVLHGGTVVAADGEYLADAPPSSAPDENSVHLGPVSEESFRLPLGDGTCPVIRVIADQIVTRLETTRVHRADGCWAFDPRDDVVLVASIERHRATGRIGLGLLAGFGLQRGALASSVAHDSHNLIVAGTNPRDMLACVRHLQRIGGGLVATADAQILATLPLPLAGLISTSRAEVVCDELKQIGAAAAQLGCALPSPFGTLSFLALPVIPEIRITSQGLFDVGRQEFVSYDSPRRPVAARS
jgi:adenine deaminase